MTGHNVAIQMARGHKITWSDARGSATYITYDGSSSTMDIAGNAIDFLAGSSSPIRLNGVKILGQRRTGFGTVSDTTSKTSWSTSTINLQDLSEKVGAIWEALRDHGLIGD